MPTTKMMANLFRALSAHDFAKATELAKDICSKEEEKGHRSAARLLRGALSASGTSALPKPHFQPRDTNGSNIISTALVRIPNNVNLENVVLSRQQRKELEQIVKEWKYSDSLKNRNLAPRSKLLFYGPPGCGKSLTAKALGNELGIPVYVVRFDAIVGAYLGQTAINLRLLFDFSEKNPCILLLDELDAIGKRRGNMQDVGELDRIVIALMQELEHSKPKGPIIGTSNLPKHLDDALWRRFDTSIQFGSPNKVALTSFAKRLRKNGK